MYSNTSPGTTSVYIVTATNLKGKTWTPDDSGFLYILLSENGNYSYIDTEATIPMGKGVLMLSPSAECTLTFSDKFRGALVRADASVIMSQENKFIPLTAGNVSSIKKYFTLLMSTLQGASGSEFSDEEQKYVCKALFAACMKYGEKPIPSGTGRVFSKVTA